MSTMARNFSTADFFSTGVILDSFPSRGPSGSPKCRGLTFLMRCEGGQFPLAPQIFPESLDKAALTHLTSLQTWLFTFWDSPSALDWFHNSHLCSPGLHACRECPTSSWFCFCRACDLNYEEKNICLIAMLQRVHFSPKTTFGNQLSLYKFSIYGVAH